MVNTSDSLDPQNTSGSSSGKLRDEELSPRLSELYQHINDFTETKQQIEAMMQLKNSFLNQGNTDVKDAEKLLHYRIKAMEAIDHLFNEDLPPIKNKK